MHILTFLENFVFFELSFDYSTCTYTYVINSNLMYILLDHALMAGKFTKKINERPLELIFIASAKLSI